MLGELPIAWSAILITIILQFPGLRKHMGWPVSQISPRSRLTLFLITCAVRDTSFQFGMYRKTDTKDRPSCDLQRAAHRATSKTQIRGLWLVNSRSSAPMANSPVCNWAVKTIWKLAENPAQSGPRLVGKLEIRAPAVKLWLFQIESRFFNLPTRLWDAN